MAFQTTKGVVGGYSWVLLVICRFRWLYRVLLVVIAGFCGADFSRSQSARRQKGKEGDIGWSVGLELML